MILRGWKEICRVLGGMSDKSARTLARNTDFPVVFIAGMPQTTDTLLEEWVENHVKRKIAEISGTQVESDGI